MRTQIEGTQMLGPSFFLNVVLNEKKEFLKSLRGRLYPSPLAACEFVEQIYGTEIPEPADLVIASCGGIPKTSMSISSKKRG